MFSNLTVSFNFVPAEGVAVGCGWQAFVAYVNVGCYYLIGIPLGVLLGFTFDLGAKVQNYRIHHFFLLSVVNQMNYI
jgi:Na+-driven multidrug efflux pump